MRRTVTLSLSLACLPAVALSADSPGFRGPGGSGVSTETGLPITWGPDKSVAWKVQVPGYGWSSPVVWGDNVFVTTAVADKQTKPGGFGGGFPGGGGRRGGNGGGGRGGKPNPDF